MPILARLVKAAGSGVMTVSFNAIDLVPVPRSAHFLDKACKELRQCVAYFEWVRRGGCAAGAELR